MCPIVSAPASPQSAASGISPIPAESRTTRQILLNLLIREFCTIAEETATNALMGRRSVALASSDDGALRKANDLDADLTESAVTLFIRGVVAERVLCADLVGHAF